MNTNWENEFWQIVEEKGIGAHVDFILALRKMFRKHVALAEKRGQEKAVEFIRENFNDQNYEEWSGLAHDDEATEEEEEAAFWMMWVQLLEQARNL